VSTETTFLTRGSSLVLILGIGMPFMGVLIRYRADYIPKAGGVSLDNEDGVGVAPRSSEPATSYFGMMNRVYRIEGWAGLYKGISACNTLFSKLY
jgi:hypothetical protein